MPVAWSVISLHIICDEGGVMIALTNTITNQTMQIINSIGISVVTSFVFICFPITIKLRINAG